MNITPNSFTLGLDTDKVNGGFEVNQVWVGKISDWVVYSSMLTSD